MINSIQIVNIEELYFRPIDMKYLPKEIQNQYFNETNQTNINPNHTSTSMVPSSPMTSIATATTTDEHLSKTPNIETTPRKRKFRQR